PESLVVLPHLSSLQLAFARAVLPWSDAVLATVHGRPLESTLLPLLGLPKIGLLTQDGTSPAAVAEFFLSRELDEYDVWICENLGSEDEQVRCFSLHELPGRRFADLNVLILVRHSSREVGSVEISRRNRAIVPPDAEFDQPSTGPILLTHADVRSVVLNRFHDLPDGPIWDLGAGLGGVAVSLARQFNELEVVAVERSPVQVDFLRRNRKKFETWNLRVVEGVAPDALVSEPPPAGIFLGGSGGKLVDILDVVFERLTPRGVFVSNFVGLENLSRTLDRLKSAGWSPEVTQVQISPGRDLAGLTTFTPLRPVWVVRAVKPGS
ncbi:precorrin-6Y C5,15-methyltransferase (decarboxylating) subunit CbiT, partial [Singulisphaera rosea]